MSEPRSPNLFRLAILLLLGGCCCCDAAIAVEPTDPLRMVQKAYALADYEVAVQLGKEVCKAQPNNLAIHYYIANSLAKLGRIDEALMEYRTCKTLGPKTEIGVKAARAIQSMTSNLQRKPAAAENAPKNSLAIALDQQLKTALDGLRLSAEKERRLAEDRFDQSVKSIQQGNATEEDLKRQTDLAFKKLQCEQADIDERYRKLTAELYRRNSAILKSSQDKSSDSRVVSEGSSMYVQNFENIGDDFSIDIPKENPLRATAGKLQPPQKLKPKSMSRTK